MSSRRTKPPLPSLTLLDPADPALSPLLSGPSSKPSSLLAVKPTKPTSTRGSARRSRGSPPSFTADELLRHSAARRNRVAEQRRRSGHTISERLAEVTGRLEMIHKHYPFDGYHLLEIVEGLVDVAEAKVQGHRVPS
jgi:hypothetical protein